jgi:hypothetical protein
MILNLSDKCLLVFIDETGHELLNDSFQKVFGLAGCAVIGGSLDTVVRQPWRDVRQIVVGSPDAPLHAADHRKPTRQQLDKVNDFFKKPFARFGAVCSVETRIDDPLTAMIIVAEALKKRLLEVLKWQPFDCVEIIFEHSQRLAPKIERAFSDFELREGGLMIPVGLNWMPKSAHEPALEVADFLANAVGAEVRHRLAGRPGFAKNFEAFFHHVDERLVSFFDVRQAIIQQGGKSYG